MLSAPQKGLQLEPVSYQHLCKMRYVTTSPLYRAVVAKERLPYSQMKSLVGRETLYKTLLARHWQGSGFLSGFFISTTPVWLMPVAHSNNS